jgi:plasmid stabilization system protein ParE
MVFEVLVADEALADLAAITGFIRDNGSPLEANRWLEAISGQIARLRSMPERCPIAFATYELGEEVRVLNHGSRNRVYRIYFTIARRPKRVIRVLHIRHWARRPFTAAELRDLL